MQTKSIYDIPCDPKTGEAFVTERNKDAVMMLLTTAERKRNRLAEERAGELHELMQMQINREILSEEQKNLCQAWQSINDAMEEMRAFFCEEYKRGELRFTSTAKRGIYQFLIAWEQFETICCKEK